MIRKTAKNIITYSPLGIWTIQFIVELFTSSMSNAQYEVYYKYLNQLFGASLLTGILCLSLCFVFKLCIHNWIPAIMLLLTPLINIGAFMVLEPSDVELYNEIYRNWVYIPSIILLFIFFTAEYSKIQNLEE